MAKNRHREEVINTQLAILISKLGVTADAETIQVHGEQMPDVLFELRGLRIVIEGKVADHAKAEQVVLQKITSHGESPATARVKSLPLPNRETTNDNESTQKMKCQK